MNFDAGQPCMHAGEDNGGGMGSQNVPPEMNIDFVLKWLSKNGLQISQHKFFGSEPQYRPSSNLSIDQVCIQPGQPDQLHLGPHPAPLSLTTPHTYSHPPPLSLGTPLTHSHPACSQPTYLQTATLHTFQPGHSLPTDTQPPVPFFGKHPFPVPSLDKHPT